MTSWHGLAVCWLLVCIAVVAIAPSRAAAPAGAAALPEPDVLQRALQVAPQTIEVIEPHLSTRDHETRIRYRGWPAALVLDHLLGPAWRAPGNEITFRALDGYVSRIPTARFLRYPAYLVFERADRPGSFVVDNPAQNERNVPLGPYYLVWDNIRRPELRADGVARWPYQVVEVQVALPELAAILPGDMADRYAADAAFAQQHCLTCHQIGGYGGDKWPIDLAQRAKQMTASEFRRWVLEPNAVRPGTSMPPLPEELPGEARQAMADRLFFYLNALPRDPR